MKNILFYKYVEIKDFKKFQVQNFALCKRLNLNGRILFSKEGVNGNLTGTEKDIDKFKRLFSAEQAFRDIVFKEGSTDKHNFRRLIVRKRDEIVTSGLDVDPRNSAEYIEPQELKKKLDTGADIVLVDMRNDYEWKIGKFENAVALGMKTFRDLPDYLPALEKLKQKEIITYCTGGVRCEKASAFLKKCGFKKIRQLHGGILQYGREIGSDHWEGKCFVFDTRGAIDIDPENQMEPISQCKLCNLPCADYYNCIRVECDRRFISCKNCLQVLHNCCGKSCRTIILSSVLVTG